MQVTPVLWQAGVARPATSPPRADLEAQQGPLQIVVWANHLLPDLIKPTDAFPSGPQAKHEVSPMQHTF